MPPLSHAQWLLTRRLPALNLAGYSFPSSILTTGTATSRRLHQQQRLLSPSYSSSALLEFHHLGNHGFNESDYVNDDDLLLDDGEEDNTVQESGEWAKRTRNLSRSGWHYPPWRV